MVQNGQQEKSSSVVVLVEKKKKQQKIEPVPVRFRKSLSRLKAASKYGNVVNIWLNGTYTVTMAQQASDSPTSNFPSTVSGSQNGSVRSSQGSSRSNGSFEVISPPATSTFGLPSSAHSSKPMADITLEQAVEKMNSLSAENMELREYLKENNAMMETQYQTMFSWKERIHQNNVFYKQKADEAKAFIQQLQTKNKEMETQLKEITVQNSNSQKQIMAMNNTIQNLQGKLSSQQGGVSMETMETVFVKRGDEQIQHLQQECSKYQDMLSRSESEIQSSRQQIGQLMCDLQTLQEVKEVIQKELKLTQSENEKLKEAHQNVSEHYSQAEERITPSVSESGMANPDDINVKTLGYSFVEHQQRSSVEQGDEIHVERVQMRAGESSDTITFLKQKAEEKERELQTLKRILQQKDLMLQNCQQQQMAANSPPVSQNANADQSTDYNMDVQGLKSQVLTLISEVQESHTKLSAACKALDVYKAKCHASEQKCSMQEEEARRLRMEDSELIKSLKNAIPSIEQALKSERADHEHTKQELKDVRMSFQNLFKDYNDLLEVVKQKPTAVQSEMHHAPIQDNRTKQLEEEKDRLTAQVIAAEEAIALREDQIQEKCQQNESLKRDLETIPVLRAQAEVFKIDFDAERQAREHLHAEKEKLVQEMHNLQIQNQQLLDEVEKLSKRQLVEMQQRHVPVSYGQAMHNYLHIGGSNYPSGQRGYNYDSMGPQHAQMTASRDPSSVDTSTTSGQPPSRISGASQHDEGEHPLFNCPKCDMQCPDIDTLQIHVMECIDQN
ncbi:hypothetical protein ScPMuIL_008391 [Solemya velum]